MMTMSTLSMYTAMYNAILRNIADTPLAPASYAALLFFPHVAQSSRRLPRRPDARRDDDIVCVVLDPSSNFERHRHRRCRAMAGNRGLRRVSITRRSLPLLLPYLRCEIAYLKIRDTREFAQVPACTGRSSPTTIVVVSDKYDARAPTPARMQFKSQTALRRRTPLDFSRTVFAFFFHPPLTPSSPLAFPIFVN